MLRQKEAVAEANGQTSQPTIDRTLYMMNDV
jgi:hypothetical protein